jgi:hypothetical protein
MKSLSLKKVGFAFFLVVASLSLMQVSSAQARRTGWRCPGNVYTNDQNLVKKLGNCQELNVTLTVMRPPGAAPRSSGGGAQARPANTNMQVSSGQQGSLDSDAKKLIEAELSKKQSELAMLQSQYNNGQPERLLIEAKDDAAYQARVERLSREIEKKVAEIASIQNELSRLR